MSAQIVRLTEQYVDAAAEMLARAFHDDPLMRYTIPDAETRTRQLPDLYLRMVRFGMLTGEVYTPTGGTTGVAVWLPPHARWTRENLEAAGMHELPVLIGDAAYQRYRAVVGCEWRARERDLPGPCWYLLLLGVEPDAQRRGIGSALIDPLIERADRERMDCYLETENERNVNFYVGRGFDLIVNGAQAGATGVNFWTFRHSARI